MIGGEGATARAANSGQPISRQMEVCAVLSAGAYLRVMSLQTIWNKIRRMLTPPGNRGSLDTEYRQPNRDEGTNVPSAGLPSNERR